MIAAAIETTKSFGQFLLRSRTSSAAIATTTSNTVICACGKVNIRTNHQFVEISGTSGAKIRKIANVVTATDSHT